MLLLSYSPVSGQSKPPQVVPTATFAPLFPTSTPYLDNLNCPVGTPAGWGTVTPNPQWQALCSRCNPTGTPPPLPTSIFPTGTSNPLTPSPTVTASPTLAASPTATYQYTISCRINGGTPAGACQQINPYTISMKNITGSQNNVPAILGAVNLQWEWGTLPVGSPLYLSIKSANAIVTSTSNNSPRITSRLPTLANYQFVPSVPTNYSVVTLSPYGSGQLYWTYEGVGVRPTGTSGQTYGQMILNLQAETLGNWNAQYAIGEVTLSTMPITLPPTPTPTPIIETGYCASVDGSSSESQFGLPVITGGTPVCGGAGGFIIPFSWFQLIGINLDDLIVPYIEVCFVPTSFGVLLYAGNNIDLDVVAYILGALFLLYLVL